MTIENLKIIIKSNFYKIFGLFLIVLTVGWCFYSWNSFRQYEGGWNLQNHIPDLIIMVGLCLLLLLPGLFYLHYKGGNNNLVFPAVILKIIAIVILSIGGLLAFISCINGCDGEGQVMFFLFYGFVSFVFYCLGVIFLLIYKFRKK